MNVMPLILETVNLRTAAADARARAGTTANTLTIERLIRYASALENRAAELDSVTAGVFDDWLAARAA